MDATPGGTPVPTGGIAGGGLIDTRAYGKLRSFNGKEEDWATWKFVAKSYFNLLSTQFSTLLEAAEMADTADELYMSGLNETSRMHAWALFNILVQSTEGRATNILMRSEQGNGFQAWRLLHDAYEPKVGGRYTAMLMGIIGPQWSQVTESAFLETLDSWEILIRRYEEQSNEEVTPATKCAVVMKFAPKGIQMALRTSSMSIGSNYELLKKCVKDYLQSGQVFDALGQAEKKDSGGAAPMDVGAVEGKGYGKKGKDKGKGKWKSKDYGKEKGKKGAKGKFDSKGKKPSQFEGYCSYCFKWGHKKAECRQKEKDKKGKGGTTNAVESSPKSSGGAAGSSTTAGIQYATLFKEDEVDYGNDEDNETYEDQSWGQWSQHGREREASRSPTYTWSVVKVPQAKRSRWSEVEDDGEGEDDQTWPAADHSGWIGAVTWREAAVNSINQEDEIFVMYDTGSDEHVCMPSFGGEGFEEESIIKLNAVSGNKLQIIGERKISVALEGNRGNVTIDAVFQVSRNSTKNILSGGKLYKAGFEAKINPEGNSMLWHEKSKIAIPLYMYGNSFYVKVADARSKPMKSSTSKRAIIAPVELEGDQQMAAGDPIEDFSEEERKIPEDIREEVYEPDLTAFSTVAEMRERLKQLGYAIHGRKQEVFERLRKAEREEKKRKEKRRAVEEVRLARNEDIKRKPQELKVPDQPTEAEVARHNLTHIPSEPWCVHCQKGKGKDTGHRRQEKDRAVLQMDYSYLKADGADAVEDPAEVVLTATDVQSGMTCAMSLPTKNFEIGYVIKTLKSFVAQLGHVQMAIRTDGEPMILNIAEKLRDELNALKLKDVTIKVFTEKTPRYSPQSLGSVGAQQALLKGDVMTLKSRPEEETGKDVTPAVNIWPWMVRHAAWTRSRFAIKANMKTAHEDAYGFSYTTPIVPFGEAVLFRMPSSVSGRRTQGQRALKGDFQWEKGIFLGKTNESDEYLVGTKYGVHTTRTVKRMREELRNPKELMDSMKGVPWNTHTSIGRPRKMITEVKAIATPKPATEGTVPGEPKPEMVKGSARKIEDQKGGEKREGEQLMRDAKKNKGPDPKDSSARLDEPELRSYTHMPGSASDRKEDEPQVAMPSRVDQEMEDSERQTEAVWRKRESELKGRIEQEEGSTKKLKVGEQFVGALYSPLEEDEDWKIDEGVWEELDVSQQPITEEEERAGKKVELDKMGSFKTYTPVPSKDAEGKTILDSTWVVTRKPSGSVRCRYCLRDYKHLNYRDDVYAVATTSATSRMIDLVGVKAGYCFFTGDATNAFWQVPIQEECYMLPPKEWLEEEEKAGRPTDVMWRLDKEWYGRRVAGTRWVEWYADQLKEMNCQRNTIAPWFFHHAGYDISLEVHMDDIYGCGPRKKVEKFLKELQKRVVMKAEIHEKGSEFTHLKRVRKLDKSGNMFIMPNPQHIKQAAEILGLESSKAAPTPAVAGGTTSTKEERPLDEEESKVYKTATGILMYVSPDRPDAQYAIRELTKDLKNPTSLSMQALIRVVRYLNGTMDYGIKFSPEGSMEALEVYSDTDWANCKKTRKSTACGVYMAGGCLLSSYSRKLSMICLSSAEAEFNGGVGATSEALFFKQILDFFGLPMKVRVWMDSSAARGIIQRQGVGRVRHLEAKSLWIQDGLKEKKSELGAVKTDENLADIGTKALAEKKIKQFREEMQMMSLETFAQYDKTKGVTMQLDHMNVATVSRIEKGLQVLMMLGMCNIPGAKAVGEESTSHDGEGSWITWMIYVSLIWTAMSMVYFAVQGLRGRLVKSEASAGEQHEESTTSRSKASRNKQTKEGKPLLGSEARRSERGEKEITYEEVDEYLRERNLAVVDLSELVAAYPTRSGDEPMTVYKTDYGGVIHLRSECGKLKAAKGVTSYKICHECHGRTKRELGEVKGLERALGNAPFQYRSLG